ncbi:MAG: GYD domain-containing protein, partial [Chloroflexi bacterium]|nr:GYD domain-containing protein [Chloroflexota bacterium]
ALGGKVEAFYFAFGETDVFTIIDAPDNATVAAASLVASASGAVQVRTTVLLAPEEIDQATRKSVSYRPPGA